MEKELGFKVIIALLSGAAVGLAGIELTRCADRIATVTGMGRIVVGSLFLAVGTSLPELFVDISAVRQKMPDLALGDLIGSSLFNLLILALADLIHKGPSTVFSRTSAAHALTASMSISVTAIAAIAIFYGPHLAKFALGEFGLGPLAIVLIYVLGLRTVFSDSRVMVPVNNGGGKSELWTNRTAKERAMLLAKPVSGYMAAGLVLLIAAPFFSRSIAEIAEHFHIAKSFAGTTIVAAATSLPELVSTMTAVRLGSFELAIGNIFGSNAFNMILIAPLDLIHQGPILASVSRSHLPGCLATILATALAVMGQLYQVERRKPLVEPDALGVILIVISALALLYFYPEP